jgi:hypothetical protein
VGFASCIHALRDISRIELLASCFNFSLKLDFSLLLTHPEVSGELLQEYELIRHNFLSSNQTLVSQFLGTIIYLFFILLFIFNFPKHELFQLFRM